MSVETKVEQDSEEKPATKFWREHPDVDRIIEEYGGAQAVLLHHLLLDLSEDGPEMC